MNASPHFPACPVPPATRTEIQLAHGGGGRLTQALIDEIFLPAFGATTNKPQHDGVVLTPPAGMRLAFSTDAHVVSPLFFPGGDIGKLAVCGTANDLAMCGARPKWLSVAFVLEEGLPLDVLRRVADSMGEAARSLGMEIVTGDTKVVERGKGDWMYVITSGVGWIERPAEIGPAAVRADDVVILSGDIGRHGIAILAQREGLAFESPVESDCAAVWTAVEALLAAGIELHCLRDPTRGGLATALIEIAQSARLAIALDESAIAVSEPVQGACELLGLDPLYVANEGRFIAFVPPHQVKAAVDVLSTMAGDTRPAAIGVVRPGPAAEVTLRTSAGSERWLDRLSGEQLPRIC